MAGISILLLNFILGFVFLSAFVGLVLFIVSMVLFRRKKKAGNPMKKANKASAIALLVISLICFLPLGISVVGIAFISGMESTKEIEKLEAIENKVYVDRYEWKDGFDYNGEHLVPVNIFVNSENYRSHGKYKNLDKIGALIMENSNDYYSFYQIRNNSGYDLYYVWVESFSGGMYFSRTFVKERDYEDVLDYYEDSDFRISALWKSAPEDTHLRNNWTSLDLHMEGGQREELVQLTHEVLDDLSDKRQVSTSWDKNYEGISFQLKSDDSVFSIHLSIYTKNEDMVVFLNNYQLEDEIVERYKEMLSSLIREAQAELLELEGEQ